MVTWNHRQTVSKGVNLPLLYHSSSPVVLTCSETIWTVPRCEGWPPGPSLASEGVGSNLSTRHTGWWSPGAVHTHKQLLPLSQHPVASILLFSFPFHFSLHPSLVSHHCLANASIPISNPLSPTCSPPPPQVLCPSGSPFCSLFLSPFSISGPLCPALTLLYLCLSFSLSLVSFFLPPLSSPHS